MDILGHKSKSVLVPRLEISYLRFTRWDTVPASERNDHLVRLQRLPIARQIRVFQLCSRISHTRDVTFRKNVAKVLWLEHYPWGKPSNLDYGKNCLLSDHRRICRFVTVVWRALPRLFQHTPFKNRQHPDGSSAHLFARRRCLYQSTGKARGGWNDLFYPGRVRTD